MYKCPCILLLLLCVVSSCQTIEELSIDYMLPAEVSFPAELRKVGVVNNIIQATPAISRELPMLGQTNSATLNWKPNANAKRATESLAQSIANENYFDEVVISDSALRAKDIHFRENTLSRNEVNQLAQELGVDFLVSLENVQINSTRTIQFVPLWNCFWGTVDVKTTPVVRVYLPNRNGPMATITPTDSIFWEEYASFEPLVRKRLIKDEQMIEEASEFAGVIPVRYLLPYWTTGMRYMYAGGNVNMRDAAFCARANDWEKAYTLWEKVYQDTKSKKKKLYLSHNIALSYEMRDSLPQAEEWARKAQELAVEIEKVDTETSLHVSPESHPLTFRTTLYLQELTNRKELFMKLNAQMRRFGNEN